MKRFRLIIMALMTISVLSNSTLFAHIISAEDGKGIRTDLDGHYLLSFLAVKHGEGDDWYFDDSTYLEYDISGLSLAAGDTVTLDIVGMRNLDGETDPAGVIEVYSYYGDGTITVDDFDAGGDNAYYRFEAAGELQTRVIVQNGLTITISEYIVSDTSIDVTSPIQDALAAGESYVGFRLSTLTSDRYDFYALEEYYIPTLNVIPEPCTLALLGLGGLLIKRKRKI